VARTKDPFLDALRDAGLLKALAGGVWPTALVRPEELETDGPVLGDAAEFISRIVRSRGKSTNESVRNARVQNPLDG